MKLQWRCNVLLLNTTYCNDVATEMCHFRVQCCYRLRAQCEPIQNPTIDPSSTSYEKTIELTNTRATMKWSHSTVKPLNHCSANTPSHDSDVTTQWSWLLRRKGSSESSWVGLQKRILLVHPPNWVSLQIGSDSKLGQTPNWVRLQIVLGSKPGILDIRARKGGLWKDVSWNIYIYIYDWVIQWERIIIRENIF